MSPPRATDDHRVRIRSARPSDYAFYAERFPELGTGDPTPARSRFEDEYAKDTLVAVQGDEELGFVHAQFLDGQGYVRQIIVSPKARRRGVGRKLMEAVRARLVASGAKKWCLNVLPDNLAAIGLYESLGFRRAHTSQSIRFPWSLVATLDPVDTPHEIVALDASAARRAEEEFGLVPGLLSSGVALPNRTGRAIATSGELVGVALFDAGFPGAFPFRVKSPTWAGPLLEALRPHRMPDNELMGLVAEDDAALATWLVERGATIRLVTMHMRGELG